MTKRITPHPLERSPEGAQSHLSSADSVSMTGSKTQTVSTGRTKAFREVLAANAGLHRHEIFISKETKDQVREIAKMEKTTAGVVAEALLRLAIEAYSVRRASDPLFSAMACMGLQPEAAEPTGSTPEIAQNVLVKGEQGIASMANAVRIAVAAAMPIRGTGQARSFAAPSSAQQVAGCAGGGSFGLRSAAAGDGDPAAALGRLVDENAGRTDGSGLLRYSSRLQPSSTVSEDGQGGSPLENFFNKLTNRPG